MANGATSDRRVPEALLPLTPAVFHILLALADGGKHGYAIMREVRERSGGAMRMSPGTLYGSIQRMRQDGLIVEMRDRVDPARCEERRRYYGLTSFGQLVLQAEAERLEQLVERGELTPAEAGAHPQRNLIYRALGLPDTEVDLFVEPAPVYTGNFWWEPIATTIVQEPNCGDYGSQVIQWSYAVSAPGYAIASGHADS